MEFCSGRISFNFTAGSTLSPMRATVRRRQENDTTLHDLHHKSLLTRR